MAALGYLIACGSVAHDEGAAARAEKLTTQDRVLAMSITVAPQDACTQTYSTHGAPRRQGFVARSHVVGRLAKLRRPRSVRQRSHLPLRVARLAELVATRVGHLLGGLPLQRSLGRERLVSSDGLAFSADAAFAGINGAPAHRALTGHAFTVPGAPDQYWLYFGWSAGLGGSDAISIMGWKLQR